MKQNAMNKKLYICFFSIAAITMVVGTMSGCGLFEAKYIDYSESKETPENHTPDPAKDECLKAAIALFESDIQPGVKATCAVSGCHLNFSTRPLSPTDSENNRKELLDYAEGSVDTLYNKYSASNGVSHQGGDKSSAIAKTNVETWLTKEAECK